MNVIGRIKDIPPLPGIYALHLRLPVPQTLAIAQLGERLFPAGAVVLYVQHDEVVVMVIVTCGAGIGEPEVVVVAVATVVVAVTVYNPVENAHLW